MKTSLRALAIAAALVAGAAARADEYNLDGLITPPPGTEAKWVIDLSAVGGVTPSYPGAKTYSFYGLPNIAIRHYGEPERFSAPDDSASIAVLKNEFFAIGPAGNWVGARTLRNNPALFGLSDVNAAIELGGFVEATPTSWLRVRGELRKAVSGSYGLVGSLGADVWRKWGRWTLSIGPRFDFGNDQYTNAYFSVEPWQAQLNRFAGGRLTAYDASGGLVDAGATAVARYEISESWRVSGVLAYRALTGSAANSPVVKVGGSDNQFGVGLELRYSFRTKDLYWIPSFF